MPMDDVLRKRELDRKKAESEAKERREAIEAATIKHMSEEEIAEYLRAKRLMASQAEETLRKAALASVDWDRRRQQGKRGHGPDSGGHQRQQQGGGNYPPHPPTGGDRSLRRIETAPDGQGWQQVQRQPGGRGQPGQGQREQIGEPARRPLQGGDGFKPPLERRERSSSSSRNGLSGQKYGRYDKRSSGNGDNRGWNKLRGGDNYRGGYGGGSYGGQRY